MPSRIPTETVAPFDCREPEIGSLYWKYVDRLAELPGELRLDVLLHMSECPACLRRAIELNDRHELSHRRRNGPDCDSQMNES